METIISGKFSAVIGQLETMSTTMEQQIQETTAQVNHKTDHGTQNQLVLYPRRVVDAVHVEILKSVVFFLFLEFFTDYYTLFYAVLGGDFATYRALLACFFKIPNSFLSS